MKIQKIVIVLAVVDFKIGVIKPGLLFGFQRLCERGQLFEAILVHPFVEGIRALGGIPQHDDEPGVRDGLLDDDRALGGSEVGAGSFPDHFFISRVFEQ